MEVVYLVYRVTQEFGKKELKNFRAGITVETDKDEDWEDIHEFANEAEARRFLNTTENSYYWGIDYCGSRGGEASEWFLERIDIDDDGNEESGWLGCDMADNADQIAYDFLDEVKGGPCFQLEFSKDGEKWEPHWSIKKDHWECWQDYIFHLDSDNLSEVLTEMCDKGFTKYRIIRWRRKAATEYEKELVTDVTKEEIVEIAFGEEEV